jgi:uncharacterized protein YndB with AHSA1/START domain
MTQLPVVVERRIQARPSTVFSFLTDPAKWTRWQGTAADLDPRPGGVYHVVVREGAVARGTFLEVIPHRRVVFTWGFEVPAGHPIAPGSSRVEIDLLPDEDGTLLRLTHDLVPPPGLADVRRGWEEYLDRLVLVAAADVASGSAMPE